MLLKSLRVISIIIIFASLFFLPAFTPIKSPSSSSSSAVLLAKEKECVWWGWSFYYRCKEKD